MIDPNTAPVVEYIYSMAEEGLGLHRIAKRLHDEKVLKPCYYKKEMFGRFIDDEKMYDWDSAYISQVLHSPVYAGHIIYEAKPTVSMKSKKRRYIPFEERAIVPNTHEAIIPQDRWENVQRILYSRSGCFMCDKTDYDNIFKGIVRCADCGRTMLVKVEHRRKRNSVLDQTFYCCSTYRKYGAKACDSHNLEARVLHEAVFADIQAHAKAAVSNREALVKKIANQMHLRVSSDRAQHKRDLKQCKARIAEIEDLYAKLYEDVSKGLLPEKRFQMLADRYDKEQAELTEKIEQYEREGRAEHDQLDKIQDFIDEVSKYAGITELNYKILHQLIDKILVSKAEKVDGEYVQKIQIFYRFNPDSDYDALYQSALCRAKADWLVGINATRLFSVLYHKTLTVGRVQTPTLKMLVDRDAKILRFQKEKYYTVGIHSGSLKADSGRISDAETANSLKEKCTGTTTVCTSVKREKKTEQPPKLYDLTTLQREANRLFGFTAKQALDYAQQLYEKETADLSPHGQPISDRGHGPDSTTSCI